MRNEPELSEAGQWYRDRDEWIRHVLGRSYLTADCQRVGIFIAMHMNRRDNHTKHQQKTIANDLNLNPSTVKRAVAKLIDEGLISKDQVQRGRRGRAVNQYRLIFAWKAL
jgi:predicted transcriptional regulator